MHAHVMSSSHFGTCWSMHVSTRSTVRLLLMLLLSALDAAAAAALCAFCSHLQEASGVLSEVAELTVQNQALNKTFMSLAGDVIPVLNDTYLCTTIMHMFVWSCPAHYWLGVCCR